MVEIIVPVALFATLAVIIVGLPIARAWARRMEHQPIAPPLANPEVLGRLERIEQSLEVMATEIERITEGQRFVTRLLSGAPPTQPEHGTILSDSARRS